MKKCITALAFIALLSFLAIPGITVFPQVRVSDKSVAQPSAGTQSIESLATSSLPAAVNFILESPSVVTHVKAAIAPQGINQKLSLSSMDTRLYENQLITEQRNFEILAAQTFSDVKVVTELRKLSNAVTIEGPGWELARLASLPGVKLATPVKMYHKTLDKSVPLINAPALWTKVGGPQTAGQGIKIAILDTGIDITNPLFADTGFTYPSGFPRGNLSFVNKKVIAAKAFLSDSSATPQDQDGHGTNVAGIAAGDSNTMTPIGPISGVAPAAYLGNYRVLDANGSGSDNFIASALETALEDGFDIASLSLGGTASAQLSFLDNAVDSAVAAGMVVTVAAGNDGPNASTIDSPGVAPDAITVGASSNAHVIAASLSVTGTTPSSLQNIEATPGFICPDPFGSGFGPLPYFVESSLPKNNKRGCKAAKIPIGSMAGGVALIERGICTFTQKINNAQAAGAIAVVIYNEDISEDPTGGDNLVFMDVTGTTIPSVFVKRSDGLALASWLSNNPGAQLRAITSANEFADPADILATFSSVGPSLPGSLKPDITAPGVNIYSGAIKTCNATGVTDPSGFTAVSGTSQATPHVAGSVALLKQLNPSWTPEQIKSALINSANTEVFADSTQSNTASVLQKGGGRIDLNAASSVMATMSPASLSFGTVKVKQPVTLTQTINVTNVTTGPLNFTVTINQLNPDPFISVTSSAPTLSLQAGESGMVTITITATKKAAKRDYTGYIIITPSSGSPQRVPYWGHL